MVSRRYLDLTFLLCNYHNCVAPSISQCTFPVSALPLIALERSLTMSITAAALFDAALRIQLANTSKWNTTSEVSNILYACEEASGISHWLLRVALSAEIAAFRARNPDDLARAQAEEDARVTKECFTAFESVGASDWHRALLSRVEEREGWSQPAESSDFRVNRAAFAKHLDTCIASFMSTETAHTAPTISQLRLYIAEVIADAPASEGSAA